MSCCWSSVRSRSSTKFNASVGCSLNQEDLRFLAAKAFRDFNLQEYDSIYLSWIQFAKDSLPGRNLTFWEWFHSILKLTREHLRDLWRPDNLLIYGFISRKRTEDVFMDKPDGPFLKPFSQKEIELNFESFPISFSPYLSLSSIVFLCLFFFLFSFHSVESMSSFQDVDLYNIMNDVDYDMDDIPADLSGVGLNDLLANANGFNRLDG